MSDVTTQAIVAFLLARYAEEEDAWWSGAPALAQNGRKFARHMLADVAAKRRIVERALGPVAHAGQDIERRATVLDLVQPYRDHAGFNAEWAPDGMRGFL